MGKGRQVAVARGAPDLVGAPGLQVPLDQGGAPPGQGLKHLPPAARPPPPAPPAT